MIWKEGICLGCLKTLADTYDANADLAGVDYNGNFLLPISHSTFNAQIEMTIDQNGNLKEAREIQKGDDAITIIPVTEDSAARSSGIAPHPLCDKLCYIAGDYSKYTGESREKYYESYMEGLHSWVQSDYTHLAIQLIYTYLKKGEVIRDLLNKEVLHLDENNKLTDQYKLQGSGQTGANVRFRVYYESNAETAVWKNQDLYSAYIAYYSSLKSEKELCYATGEWTRCSDKHPSKIRNSGDKAKLISGNDDSGFTYRGRFVDKNQAALIGYETSQKAHNALRWLLKKQGYTKDGSAMVAWMINRKEDLPDISTDSIHSYEIIDGFDLDAIFDEVQEKSVNETGQNFAKKFRDAVNGYAKTIESDDKVAIIALDAATTGRLSISYYDEMGGQQYITAIQNWQKHCAWKRFVFLGDKDNPKALLVDNSPAPRDIALAAYGVQRGGKGYLETDSKLINSTVKRLLPCITHIGIKIPEDIIRAAVRRASRPEAMSDKVWENQVLRITCAMIRYNYEKGEDKMGTFLENNKGDRSVLFGRLLAICDYMEQRAQFEKDENGKIKEQRTTNAKRYWNAFSSRPAKTYKTIRENLIVYEKKLSYFEKQYFENCRNEIETLLATSGYDSRPLTEMYLPGYSLQMEQMRAYFSKDKKIDSENSEK